MSSAARLLNRERFRNARQNEAAWRHAFWLDAIPALRLNLDVVGRTYAVVSVVPAPLLGRLLAYARSPTQLYAALDPARTPRADIPPWAAPYVDADGVPTRSLVEHSGRQRPLSGIFHAVRTSEVDDLEVACDRAGEYDISPGYARIALDAMWSAYRTYGWRLP